MPCPYSAVYHLDDDERDGHLDHNDGDDDLDHDGDNLSRRHQTVAVPQLETNQWCLKVATMSEYTLWMIIC